MTISLRKLFQGQGNLAAINFIIPFNIPSVWSPILHLKFNLLITHCYLSGKQLSKISFRVSDSIWHRGCALNFSFLPLTISKVLLEFNWKKMIYSLNSFLVTLNKYTQRHKTEKHHRVLFVPPSGPLQQRPFVSHCLATAGQVHFVPGNLEHVPSKFCVASPLWMAGNFIILNHLSMLRHTIHHRHEDAQKKENFNGKTCFANAQRI